RDGGPVTAAVDVPRNVLARPGDRDEAAVIVSGLGRGGEVAAPLRVAGGLDVDAAAAAGRGDVDEAHGSAVLAEPHHDVAAGVDRDVASYRKERTTTLHGHGAGADRHRPPRVAHDKRGGGP